MTRTQVIELLERIVVGETTAEIELGRLKDPSERMRRVYKNAAQLRRLAVPGERTFELSDATHRGLRLRVQPSRTRTWWYVYRDGNQTRRIKLGIYTGTERGMTLSAARDRADYWAGVRHDERMPDPHELLAEQRAEKAAQKAQEVAESETTAYTLRKLGEGFVDHQQRETRPRTWQQQRDFLNRYAYPVLGDEPVVKITADMIGRRLLEPIDNKGHRTTRNSLRMILVSAFKWAVLNGPDYVRAHLKLHGNPAAETVTLKIHKDKSKAKRALHRYEAGALWSELRAARDNYSALLALQLATGQRITETALAEWRHVDLDRAVWTIPGTVAKTGETHHVALSSQAVRILQARPGPRTGRVFPNATGPTAAKRLKRIAARAGVAQDDPAAIGTHSLRKTCATGVTRWLRYPVEVQHWLLNHTSGDTLATIYAGDPEEVGREAWLRWGECLDSLADGGEVVELVRRRRP